MNLGFSRLLGGSKLRDKSSSGDERSLTAPKSEPPLTDRLGYTILARPQESKAIIIFIHGLTGGSVSTWTKNSVLWPKEHLARDIPDAIIATFGYDADVVKFFGMAGSNNISGHARTLATSICALLEETRNSDATLLPVYICAHSLGGLVAEKAYLDARDHDELHPAYEQVRGIVFFGTPHGGSGSAKMGLALSQVISWLRRTNKQLVRDLKPCADILSELADRFHAEQRQSASTKPLELRYFYEELAVPLLGKIVERDSAVVPGFPHGSIHADHIGMTKMVPSENSEYAQLILPWMKSLVTLPSHVATESQPAATSSSQNSSQGLPPTFNFNGSVKAKKVAQGIYTSGSGTTNLTL